MSGKRVKSTGEIRFNRQALGTISGWQTSRAMEQEQAMWFPRARRIDGIIIKESDVLPPPDKKAVNHWERSWPVDGITSNGVTIASFRGKRTTVLNGPGIQIPREDIPEVIKELKKHI